MGERDLFARAVEGDFVVPDNLASADALDALACESPSGRRQRQGRPARGVLLLLVVVARKLPASYTWYCAATLPAIEHSVTIITRAGRFFSTYSIMAAVEPE